MSHVDFSKKTTGAYIRELKKSHRKAVALVAAYKETFGELNSDCIASSFLEAELDKRRWARVNLHHTTQLRYLVGSDRALRHLLQMALSERIRRAADLEAALLLEDADESYNLISKIWRSILPPRGIDRVARLGISYRNKEVA